MLRRFGSLFSNTLYPKSYTRMPILKSYSTASGSSNNDPNNNDYFDAIFKGAVIGCLVALVMDRRRSSRYY